jgi:phosphoglucosamine mutase
MAEMKRKLFGTDGVRGEANVGDMTPDTAMAMGRAVAAVFRAAKGARTRVLIGKDTRLSGYIFETALEAGVCSMGADTMLVGPLPTPGIAYLTASMRADAGAVISASHNPFQDNGIKFFGGDGFKLPDELEARMERLVEDPSKLAPARGREIGRATRVDDALGRYCVFLKSQFPRDLSLDGVRIAIDCANGAAYRVGPMVLRELGAEVAPIGIDPDGTNINEGCGSLHPESLRRKVVEHGCQVGVALDGDGDRCLLVDEKGALVDGDAILAICADRMHAEGSLRGGGIVGTIVSNFGLQAMLERRGLTLFRADVGDRYVVEMMKQRGCNVGGEQSGHLLFLDNATTGDGLLSALKVLALMLRAGRPLSELGSVFDRFPQVERNMDVARKPPLASLARVTAAKNSVEDAVRGRGSVVVRYSGTQAKIRVTVECEDAAEAARLADSIVDAAREDGILA